MTDAGGARSNGYEFGPEPSGAELAGVTDLLLDQGMAEAGDDGGVHITRLGRRAWAVLELARRIENRGRAITDALDYIEARLELADVADVDAAPMWWVFLTELREILEGDER